LCSLQTVGASYLLEQLRVLRHDHVADDTKPVAGEVLLNFGERRNMTFEELELRLPNGFHDAAIREINLDFIGRSVVLGMDVLTGGPGDPDPELCRPGTLKLSPAYLFFIEPPDPRYSFVPNGSALKVDGDSVRAGQNVEVDRLSPMLPQNATKYRFFLEKWNAFLYLAGGGAEFSWDSGEAFS
jgi:hypothetical protein